MTIGQFLSYLNQNQGALLIILTFVYVLSSIITVIFISRSNRLVRESNKIAQEAIVQSMILEKERNRPYVIFDLIIKTNVIYAELRNIGKTPAINVNVIIDKKIADLSTDKKPPSFSERPIAFMAPNRLIRDFVNTSFDIFKDEQPHVYNIKIIYKNTDGNTYEEESIVDLDHNKDHTYLVPPEHLKDISNELKNANRNLHEIDSSLNYLVWEQNSLIDEKSSLNIAVDDKFDAGEFIKKIFKDSVSWEGKFYFNLLTYRATKENEKIRNNLLHCEKLGLLRRERSYFVLTDKGHEIIN